MKKAVKQSEKRNEGKRSVKTHQARANGKAKSEPERTLADEMDDLIFNGETDPQMRMEKLEVWRCRNEGTRNEVFQQDLERMAYAALKEQDYVEVMVPVTLTAVQWQKLIALGADAARESLNGIAIEMPEWGNGGPLGDVVSAVLEKSLSERPVQETH